MLRFTKILAVFCIALATTTGGLRSQEFSSEYRPLTLPEIPLTARSLLAVLDEFAVAMDVDLSHAKLSISDQKSATIVTIEARRYMDDSLSGEDFRISITRDSRRYVIQEAGVLYVCARGSVVGIAQPNLCP